MRGTAPGGRHPPPPASLPTASGPLSEVGARGGRERQREELIGSQAPSPAAVLPGLLQVHGGLLNFRKMIKFTTGKEPATSYSLYGCYCGIRGRGTPKDASSYLFGSKLLFFLRSSKETENSQE